MRSLKVLLLVILGLAGITPALSGWLHLKPQVTPEDIVLNARLRPLDSPACAPGSLWVLEVELNRSRPVPLNAGQKPYRSAVHVFDGEKPLDPDDYGERCHPTFVNFADAGLSLGNDGRTYTLALRRAVLAEALPPDFPETRSAGAGFTYTGDQFPIKVLYFLQDAPPEPLAVVYVHDEQRLGRDLSWSKVLVLGPGRVTVASTGK